MSPSETELQFFLQGYQVQALQELDVWCVECQSRIDICIVKKLDLDWQCAPVSHFRAQKLVENIEDKTQPRQLVPCQKEICPGSQTPWQISSIQKKNHYLFGGGPMPNKQHDALPMSS